MRRLGSKAIPLVVQLHELKKRYTHSSGKISKSCLKWECRLRPQDITDTYLIQIEYRMKRKPVVYISEGRLSEEKDLNGVPHKYGVLEDGRVQACLERYDWKDTLFLADSIVPWAMEWALHYEMWLATGKWLAAEAPHGAKKNTLYEED